MASEQLVFVQAQERAKTEEAIHDEILDGVVEQRSVKKITANIANQMENWGRDWGRIVETEHQDVFNVGRATYFMSEDDDPLVYFDVFPGACKHCIRLFLTAGIGSKPKVFKLSTLLANGTNYGVKAQNWKATIHPVHPFCRCDLRYVPKGYVWDDKKGEFVPPENFERTVPRKSKVKITIGEKEYLV